VLVNLKRDNDGVDFNYYNPTKNHDFLPGDYLTTNIKDVKDKVAKSNS
jgi:hypothetical protein